MSRLAVKAELDKLCQTLDLEHEEIDFLESFPAEQLRGLRVSIYEMLFHEDRELFRRLGRVVSRMPAAAAVAASLRAGPIVTARIAAELPARRVVEISTRLEPDFGADVVAHLDPRRTRDAIRALDVDWLIGIAHALIERGDFITPSRFVEFLSDDAVRALEEAVEDEGALLRIAFYIGSKNRLDHLINMLPDERIERLILQVADESQNLLSEFLSLLIHVSYALKRKLGDIAAAQDEDVLTAYVRAAHDQQLWADLLPVVASMSPTAQRKVVDLAILRDPDVQAGILRAADEHGLWSIVLPMIVLMDDDNRAAVAAILADRPAAALAGAADAALMGEHWEALLDLVRRMQPAKHAELAAIVRGYGEVDPDLLERIEARARACGVELGAAATGTPAGS
jgi:hypothetical protein